MTELLLGLGGSPWGWIGRGDRCRKAETAKHLTHAFHRIVHVEPILDPLPDRGKRPAGRLARIRVGASFNLRHQLRSLARVRRGPREALDGHDGACGDGVEGEAPAQVIGLVEATVLNAGADLQRVGIR